MRYTLYAVAAIAVYLWVWSALNAEYRHAAGQVSPFSHLAELLK